MNKVFAPDRSFGLHFLVGRERDKKILYNWNWDWDPGGVEARAAEKGIPYEFARRLRDAADYGEVREEIDAYIDALHESKGEDKTFKNYTCG